MTRYEPLVVATFPQIQLKPWLIGSFIATMAYGVVLSLALAYLHDFIRFTPTATSKGITADAYIKTRFFFLAYALFMFSCSTLSFVAATIGTLDMFFPSPQGINVDRYVLARFCEASCLVLGSWGADGLMFWRCIGLYKTSSTVNRTLLYILFTTLSLASLVTGTGYIVTGIKFLNRFMIACAITSAITNTITTVLIICRILYRRKHIKNSLGPGYTPVFTRLVHLFIESASLIVLFNLAHVSLTHWPYLLAILPHQLLVHVYVTSALLILYRISYGIQPTGSISATIELDTELRCSPPESLKSGSGSWMAKDEELGVKVSPLTR